MCRFIYLLIFFIFWYTVPFPNRPAISVNITNPQIFSIAQIHTIQIYTHPSVVFGAFTWGPWRHHGPGFSFYVNDTGRFMNGVLKWEGPSSDFTRQAAKKKKKKKKGGGMMEWRAWWDGTSWRCLKTREAGLLCLRTAAERRVPSRAEPASISWDVQADSSRAAGGQLAPAQAAQSQRRESRVGEPWVSARRTRARRCWATSLWSRIMPTWFRVWPWLSSSAWCSRYCLFGHELWAVSPEMLAAASRR